MTKLAMLKGHDRRVLYLAASPDGQTIVTGAGALTEDIMLHAVQSVMQPVCGTACRKPAWLRWSCTVAEPEGKQPCMQVMRRCGSGVPLRPRGPRPAWQRRRQAA